MRTLPVLLLALALTACAPEEGLDPPELQQSAAALGAPLETWTYVPVPESRCGNGSSTGFAVNVSQRSNRLVLFLEGGNACWDYSTCVVQKRARHIDDTVGAQVVLADALSVPFVFDRNDARNPFRDATFVYVPYCTGDVHAGNHTASYSGRMGQFAIIEHRGAANLEAFLSRVVPAFPQTERVWLMGRSAGGYGAMLNWEKVQTAFGRSARVDVFSDSGAPIDIDPSRYAQMRSAWRFEIPAACDTCDQNLGGLADALEKTFPPPHRFAFASFRRDDVLAGDAPPHGFCGIDYATYGARLDGVRTDSGPGQKTYFVDNGVGGEDHILIGKIGLVVPESFPRWLQAFAFDDPRWDHLTVP